ncbi:MAG TPA: response regulator [Bryobacterales bacterium]|nr:response regulator [Bryobacterales bacterium]
MRELNQKLLAVFQVEHKEHLEQIRSLLEHLEKGAGVSPGPELDEVFRRAHSLKGAARAVDLRPVETLAHRLETLFSRVREGALRVDQPVLEVIRQTLDATEDLVACLGENRKPADPAPVLEAIERVLGMEPDARPAPPQAPVAGVAADAAPMQPIETVRVGAESLDRLLGSSGRLLAESLSQDRVTQQLNHLARDIAGMEKEWERSREASSLPLKRLAAMPEFARLGRHLDSVRQQVRSLSSQARTVCLLQQRSNWALRHLSEQLQQDVCRVRMAPAESVFDGFRKMVRDLAADEGKQIAFRVSGLEVQADRMVLQALKDPVMHLLRNAVCHGIESSGERAAAGKAPVGQVRLALETRGDRLRVLVEDDGRGIDVAAVRSVAVRKGLVPEAEAGLRPPEELARLIFLPGFSTSKMVTDLAGRGMGLSIVSEHVKRLQGQAELQGKNGPGVSILLSVPLSISTERLLLVACAGQTFAIPAYSIERLCRIEIREVQTVEGKPAILLQGRPVRLATLAELLGLPADAARGRNGAALPAVVLKAAESLAAVVVDAFLAEKAAPVKDLGIPQGEAGKTAGGILLEDGSVAVVLNPAELLNAFQGSGAIPVLAPGEPAAEKKQPNILVVDDSITTRSLEKSILEAHGYRVRVAVDGVEALAQLRSERADLVIADVQMPRLDGFGLLAEMKRDEHLGKIPVIIVTSLERREDQEKGLALGADAYIVKRKFDQRDLLDTIRQIL